VFLGGLALSTIGVLSLGFNLATLIPSLSVLVRRLRDAGYSWTWLLASIGALAVLMTGIVGIVALAVKAGLMNWSALANPDEQIDDAVVQALVSDPSFGIYAVIIFVGLLLTIGSGILVNIIFPAMPSKSAADGNKRLKPESL
ncbi:MAG: hypothetical protein EBR26_01000, partial [Microbacteriaceae bacterium]|nr:hypothetical protein [Microbacteriaceae bacterium]